MAVTLSFPAAILPEDAIEVARIGGAWGVKGWFKVQPYSSAPEALFNAGHWFLQPPEKGARHFEGTVALDIVQVRPHGDGLVGQAQGAADRDVAEALRGARVFVSRVDFPALPEGEYYWVDLMGLDVINREGVHLGVVQDLLSTGPQTVLAVQAPAATPEGKPVERLIPFVEAYVDGVDLSARRVTVDWQPDY